MKKAWLLAIIGLVMFIAAGCETIKGIGKDVSTAGGWLTRGSQKVQGSGPIK